MEYPDNFLKVWKLVSQYILDFEWSDEWIVFCVRVYDFDQKEWSNEEGHFFFKLFNSFSNYRENIENLHRKHPPKSELNDVF